MNRVLKFFSIFWFFVAVGYGQSFPKSTSCSTSPFNGYTKQFVFQPVNFTLSNPTASIKYFRAKLGNSIQPSVAVPSGGTAVLLLAPSQVYGTGSFEQFSGKVTWSGLSFNNPSVQGSFPSSSYVVAYDWMEGGTVKFSGSFPVSGAGGNTSVSYVSGNQSTSFDMYPPINLSATYGATDISPPPPDDVGKLFGSGVIMIENLTGMTQKLPFGAEEITLAPGYNSVPFTGQLDADGYPKAMPQGWSIARNVGPDGQVIWSGRMSSGIEGGPPVWTATPATQILPGPPGSGPTIKIPNAKTPSLTDYVQLPAGMSKGGNLTLPPGMAAGSPGLPAGVTGGSAGALPSGTLSGGSFYLPKNVSAGTKGGNGAGATTPAPGGVVGSGGGGIVTSGPSADGESGGYIAGASMDGMNAEGENKGKAAAEKIKSEVSAGLSALDAKSAAIYGPSAGLAASYWTTGGDAALSGFDRSWLNITIPIAQYSIPISIPPYWIDLIRSILVWGVKIWFVVAVLKLLMR